jgi:hypothetical protein
MTDDTRRPSDDELTPPQERAGFPSTPGAPGEDGIKPDWPQDAGAYIGHEPERGAGQSPNESIPGGVRPDDQRIAANSSQGTGVGRPDKRGQFAREPEGHRWGDRVSDDDLRQAGDAE